MHCKSQRKGGLAQAGGAGRAARCSGACVRGRCVAAAQRAARSAAPLLLMVVGDLLLPTSKMALPRPRPGAVHAEQRFRLQACRNGGCVMGTWQRLHDHELAVWSTMTLDSLL